MPYTSTHRRSFGGSSTRRRFGGGNSGRSGGGNKMKKDNIHPSRFVKPAKPVATEEYAPMHTFADFAMHDILKQNIQTKGYTNPSPIQDQSIPVGLTGSDIVGIANTGTGKTVAFAIPVLDRLMNDPRAKALIMAPTRELAQQILDEFKWIGKGSGLWGTLLIGGTAMGPQLRDLRDRPRVIIGTPGRIKDHMERGSLDLGGFNTVVLDEVDRMLDMGFIHDMRHILGQMQPERQSFFFSATMDRSVRTLIDSFSSNPVNISVKTSDTSDNVEQDIVTYNGREDKIEKLHDTLVSEYVVKTVIFDDTQRSVERLSKELEARGFKVDAIHGGKSQGQRQRALNRFKASEINVLVATDVAARGIDVVDITHVINYATPKTYEDYTHRIGRAGRAGRTGYALTFIEK